MFYLYAILDLRKPGHYSTPYVSFLYEPFYIGKGNGCRYNFHRLEAESKIGKKGKRTYKTNLILKQIELFNEYPCIQFHYEEDETICYLKEFDLVEHFGLYSEGGILHNVKPGGKGNSKGYVYCYDNDKNVVYVKQDDKRIGKELHYTHKGKTIAILQDGSTKFVDSDDPRFLTGEIKNFHTGRKRSEETREKIKKSREGMVFTEEHLANIKIANQLIADKVHKDAKRPEKWKTNISKSRFGSKSKVAKIWSFTSPKGETLIYKGGRALGCEIFKLSVERVKKNVGLGPIPAPTHTGHLTESVYRCTGWDIKEVYDDSLINFEFRM